MATIPFGDLHYETVEYETGKSKPVFVTNRYILTVDNRNGLIDMRYVCGKNSRAVTLDNGVRFATSLLGERAEKHYKECDNCQAKAT